MHSVEPWKIAYAIWEPFIHTVKSWTLFQGTFKGSVGKGSWKRKEQAEHLSSGHGGRGRLRGGFSWHLLVTYLSVTSFHQGPRQLSNFLGLQLESQKFLLNSPALDYLNTLSFISAHTLLKVNQTMGCFYQSHFLFNNSTRQDNERSVWWEEGALLSVYPQGHRKLSVTSVLLKVAAVHGIRTSTPCL